MCTQMSFSRIIEGMGGGAFVGSFVRSLRAGVQPTLDPSAETFTLVQCASPGRGGELVGVCGVCARCVGWRKEQ